MARFVIDLGNIELSRDDEQEARRIAAKVALGKVAAAGAGKIVEQPLALRFPREWLGLILRERFEDVLQVEKQVAEFERQFG